MKKIHVVLWVSMLPSPTLRPGEKIYHKDIAGVFTSKKQANFQYELLNAAMKSVGVDNQFIEIETVPLNEIDYFYDKYEKIEQQEETRKEIE